MITVEDKLRFELGEGFDNLSPEELAEDENYFNECFEKCRNNFSNLIKNNSTSEFWKYIDTLYLYYLLNKYKNSDEKFISAMIEFDDEKYFSWALSKIDPELVPYAEKQIGKYLTDTYNCDNSKINEILNRKVIDINV